jgi:hypothetical protein
MPVACSTSRHSFWSAGPSAAPSGRRRGLVQLLQRFGDGRAVLFKHCDGHGQLGPDLVGDQVGKVARLPNASTSSTRERLADERVSPLPHAVLDGMDHRAGSEMRPLPSVAT